MTVVAERYINFQGMAPWREIVTLKLQSCYPTVSNVIALEGCGDTVG